MRQRSVHNFSFKRTRNAKPASCSIKTLCWICSLVLAFVLVGCDNRDVKTSTNQVYVQIDNVEDFLFVDEERAHLVILDKSKFVGRIDKLLISETRIYVVDKSQDKIFSFDREGRFIFVLDKYGRGPGEYSTLNSVELNYSNNTIEITDLEKRSVLIYSAEDGKFLKKDSFDFYPVLSIPLNTQYRVYNNQLIPNGRLNNSKSFCVYLVNNENGEINEYFEHFWNDSQSWAISRINHWRIDGSIDRINYKPHYTTEIWEIGPNEVQLKYDLIFNTKTSKDVIDEFGDKPISNSDYMNILFDNNYVHNLENFLESEGQFYFTFQKGTRQYQYFGDPEAGSTFRALRLGNMIVDIPKVVYQQEYYSVLEYEKVQKLMNVEEGIEKYSSNEKFLEELGKLELLKDNSNPVLLVYDLN